MLLLNTLSTHFKYDVYLCLDTIEALRVLGDELSSPIGGVCRQRVSG